MAGLDGVLKRVVKLVISCGVFGANRVMTKEGCRRPSGGFA
jgi:hypothetical protein